MLRMRLADLLMTLIIFAVSLWLLDILVNDHSTWNRNRPRQISANGSCFSLNATHFLYEDLLCANRLTRPSLSLECWTSDKVLEYRLLSSRVKRETLFFSSLKTDRVCYSSRVRYSFSRSSDSSQSLLDLLLFFVACSLIAIGLSVSLILLYQFRPLAKI